jgi:catalase
MNASESHPPAELSRASLILRLAVIGVVLGGIVGAFAYAGGWLTPHALSPTAMVDRFQQVNGTFPGFRRNHAKGVCITGTFESNGNGVALSKATIFPAGRVPFVGRFAFAGGQPYVADTPHLVRSLAVLFQLPDGEEWRTGCINIPVFPVHTTQAFYDLLLATAPDPATGKPDPAKVKALLE